MASSYTKSVEVADFKFQIKYIGSVPCFQNYFQNKSEIIKLGPVDYMEEISFEDLQQFLKGIHSELPSLFSFIE